VKDAVKTLAATTTVEAGVKIEEVGFGTAFDLIAICVAEAAKGLTATKWRG
jgi:hypothetical protein